MSSDQFEDEPLVSKPPGVNPPPRREPAEPSKPAPNELPWGVIGDTTRNRLPSGRYEVLRSDIGVDVVLAGMPIATGEKWQWVDKREDEVALSGKDGGLDFMREELDELHTLVQYRAAEIGVWEAKKTDETRDAALDKLDMMVGRLVDVARQIHEKGGGLGLLTPAGILVHGAGPDLSVFLCDADFRYVPGSHAEIPRWLNQRGRAYKDWKDLLPNADPREALGGTPQEDLRKLVRVLIWLLTGEQHISTATVDPTKTYAGIWRVLRQVEDGTISTATALRDALRVHRISGHFRGDRESMPPGSAPAVLRFAGIAAALLVMLVLTAGLGWLALKGRDHPPAAPISQWALLIPRVPAPKKPAESLPAASRFELKRVVFESLADSNRSQRYEALVAAYETPPSSRPQIAIQECQYLCFLRHDFTQRLDQEMQRLIERSEQEHMRLYEIVAEVREIDKIFRELQDYPAHPTTKQQEKSCHEYCQHWLAGQPLVE